MRRQLSRELGAPHERVLQVGCAVCVGWVGGGLGRWDAGGGMRCGSEGRMGGVGRQARWAGSPGPPAQLGHGAVRLLGALPRTGMCAMRAVSSAPSPHIHKSSLTINLASRTSCTRPHDRHALCRVLKLGASAVIVTYGDPLTRLWYFHGAAMSWAISVYCIAKPESLDNLGTFNQAPTAVIKGPFSGSDEVGGRAGRWVGAQAVSACQCVCRCVCVSSHEHEHARCICLWGEMAPILPHSPASRRVSEPQRSRSLPDLTCGLLCCHSQLVATLRCPAATTATGF